MQEVGLGLVHHGTAAATTTTRYNVIVRGSRDLVAQNTTDAADRRHVVLVTDDIGEQFVAYFPRKDARILLLVSTYGVDDPVSCDTWLAAADRAG